MNPQWWVFTISVSGDSKPKLEEKFKYREDAEKYIIAKGEFKTRFYMQEVWIYE